MIDQSIERLAWLCNHIPLLLRAVADTELSLKPAPHQWSKKQILGHLIDSATNNHQRFVRGQFETLPHISYDQNAWNTYSYYDLMPAEEVISFWEAYNRHLLSLVLLIPAGKLTCEVHSGDPVTRTIEFLINDYVVHLEHHLRQIVDY